jgi:hypothetical protein
MRAPRATPKVERNMLKIGPMAYYFEGVIQSGNINLAIHADVHPDA